MKTAAFWDGTVQSSRSLQTFHWNLMHPSAGQKNPECVDSAFLRNFGKILSDYTVSHPRRRGIPNQNHDLREYWSMRDLKILTTVTAGIKYMESMGQSQNTAVLQPDWPTFFLLSYWFDNMFRPFIQAIIMSTGCSYVFKSTTVFCNVHLSLQILKT